jgi:hypothetical protein
MLASWAVLLPPQFLVREATEGTDASQLGKVFE